jgi:cytochrome c553
MRKWILTGVAVTVCALLAWFGPVMLDLYRLDRFVAASADAAQAEGGPWPRAVDVCINCHGMQGNSQHQAYPSLAGQPAPYLAAQLRKFASGERANPNMGPLAMTMDDAEIDRFAQHFARQAATPNRSFQPDAAVVAKGKALVQAAHCAACHGEQLMGQGAFARLAGQGHDYLVMQLAAFAAGTRNEATGTMKAIATNTPPQDIEAMAHYLASLAPVNR